ncbi:hypothetical protein [uncultured Oscillibacter sp.]|uniref:hypothetical protein n=1 Tax=uncultured Oscillibacter sp. TaxID=876091 RepID=UPI0025DEC6E8|nr:hypothetical protein [uncultured Oscillibacter sp.]
MADKRRLNLSFSMASPFQREAWKRLCAIPSGQRTDAVCRAVCRMYEQDTLLETVRQIIREELRGVELISAKEKAEQPQAGDVDDNVLGFLLALQNDGGDE